MSSNISNGNVHFCCRDIGHRCLCVPSEPLSDVGTNTHQERARTFWIVVQGADYPSQITRGISQKKYCWILTLERGIRVFQH